MDMAKAITQEKIIEINELYLKLKTYAAVSRALGGSPSPTTVKKYVIPGYTPKDALIIKKFEGAPPMFSPKEFVGLDNWGELCVLSEEEKKEIRFLWEELVV